MLWSLWISWALAGSPWAVVLGVAQDAGHPQAGCTADHCQEAWTDHTRRHHPASLGLVSDNQFWMIDATPAFPDQSHTLHHMAPEAHLSGILLTHAHMGHYAGLVHLGREAMGASNVDVFAMPKMASFLRDNAPWELLVRLENITVQPLSVDTPVQLGGLSITPWVVPHRDEYTETVGFLIRGPEKSALYLPDIDRWEQWDRDLVQVLDSVDVAWVDGTFFSGDELPGRDMSKIPHPTITSTMEHLASLPKAERSKIHFIHLNHTNPALDPNTTEAKRIRAAGFSLAVEGQRVEL